MGKKKNFMEASRSFQPFALVFVSPRTSVKSAFAALMVFQ